MMGSLQKHFLIGLLVVSAILAAGTNASADTLVLTTNYNGHTYELWDALGISWTDARTAAEGDGGYLAVLTDGAETAAVFNAFIGQGFFQPGNGQGIQAWLGGYTADGSGSTANPLNWAWITGEAWTAFDAGNFAPGEPNGDSSGLAINRYGTYNWNDEGGYVGGYIVEKRTAVPEGGSLISMIGIGLAGLAAIRRKYLI